MENKKLVNILLKDMGELEEMVAEIKLKGNFDSLEIEFLHTRAKGIMQLLQMLNGQENGKPVPESIQKIVEEIPEKITDIKETATIAENSLEEEKTISETEEMDQKVEPEPGNILEQQQDKKMEEKNEEEVPVEENEIKEENPVVSENDDVELEDEEISESNQRLGDSFLKGRSVNDIIHDPNKLEFKLSNRPVSSIRSAIGINDRFQYIRELFDGSSEKFADTVASLDEMNNINEAVTFLQQNFKWKKNETSLKFVNLVKRRFTNA